MQGESEKDMSIEGMKRFEEMCRTYLNGNDRTRRIILSFLSEEEKQTFLEGCGLYHLFTDENYYKIVRQSIGAQLYNDFHKAQAAG